MDHLFFGQWRDVVLQRRELLDVLGRQEVRARRQYLPKLRVGRAEFLERSSQSLGLPALAGRALLIGPSEQFPQSMFAQLAEILDSVQIIELTATIAWENYRSRFYHALGIASHGFSDSACCLVQNAGSSPQARSM